jgi:hypothetical protein
LGSRYPFTARLTSRRYFHSQNLIIFPLGSNAPVCPHVRALTNSSS